VEIDYRDWLAKREKLTRIDIVLIGLTKIYGDLRVLLGTIGALRRNEMWPEVIHVHSANYLLSGVILKFLYRAPLCLNFGGTELLRAERIPYYRWMFRRLDRGFYVAHDMETRLYSMMDPSRCVYTGNGIDHGLFFADNLAEKLEEIICVGNLRWQKDYHLLIEAFAQIAGHFPTWRVRIFGDGPERRSLEAQIAAAGLEGRIVLEGMQPQELIRDALQRAQLFVICSKAEGFPKALIEAMACGLPVVATNAGECATVLGGISPTVPVGDAGALAVAISEMLSDHSRRTVMADACQQRSMDFSWQRVSDIVEATYDGMVV
jgi:glycosyltransferase involved in cell wall biosynthesis